MTQKGRMTKLGKDRSGTARGCDLSTRLRHPVALLLWACLTMTGAALSQLPSSQEAETIKIGPLKPLETLPSLSPMLPPAKKAPAAAVEAKEQKPAPPPAAPPPLPTTKSLVLDGPVAQAYLYIEPYQTRFEALFDAAAIFAWLYPGKAAPQTLAAEKQEELAAAAAARAAQWCALKVTGTQLTIPQPVVAVIKGVPGNTLPIKEGEAVPLNQAMLGFMWEFATPPGPEEIVVTWKGWFNQMPQLPVHAYFGRHSEKGEIYSSIKTFRWSNRGRLPRPAPLAAVPSYEEPSPLRLPLGGIFWFLGGLVFYIFLKVKDHRLPGGSLPYIAVWLLGAVLMSQLLIVPVGTSSGPVVDQVADAQRIVTPLLRNVYRAFDHHAESDVYDVLARSVDGELLRKLYLETIQALTLDGREGTRVTIAEFSANVDKVAPNPKGEGFVADCNWMARGIVGHWGHSHPRVNIYNARVTITPAKGEWKLTDLEVQEVRRL